MSSNSRWAAGPPAIIRHERSATTMPASAHSREASNIRRDQSAFELERVMGFLRWEEQESEKALCGRLGPLGRAILIGPRQESACRMFTNVHTDHGPGVAKDAVRESAITQPEAQKPACRTAKCGAGGRHRSIIAFPECQESSALPLRQ